MNVVVRRGFTVPLTAYLLIGVIWGAFTQVVTADDELGISIPTTPLYALLFTAAALAGNVLHEGGHAAAAAAVSNVRPVALVFQLRGMAVHMSDTIPGGWRGAAIAAAGPLLELGVAVAVLASFNHWPLTYPLGFAAVFSLLSGLSNLLLPTTRNSDAARIYRAVFRRPEGN